MRIILIILLLILLGFFYSQGKKTYIAYKGYPDTADIHLMIMIGILSLMDIFFIILLVKL